MFFFVSIFGIGYVQTLPLGFGFLINVTPVFFGISSSNFRFRSLDEPEELELEMRNLLKLRETNRDDN